jgi:hypothetical protein
VTSFIGRRRELSVAEAIAGGQERGAGPGRRDLRRNADQREREIAELVSQGLGNREIAEQLVLAKRTVDSHIEHIFSKLGVPHEPSSPPGSAARTQTEALYPCSLATLIVHRLGVGDSGGSSTQPRRISPS